MKTTIYERIRDLRIKNNMSQDDLARAMGYKDRSMITKIESGKVDISQKKILAFARVLNTTPGYLMGWRDEVKLDLSLFNGDRSVQHTKEARIISGGIDKMPPDRREQALNLLKVAFSEYADYFKEDHNDDA